MFRVCGVPIDASGCLINVQTLDGEERERGVATYLQKLSKTIVGADVASISIICHV